MNRYTYPIFRHCNAPEKAILQVDNTYKLSIDLKKAFHHTYIDVHGRPPKEGTNPFFDEYEDLLDTSDELRFQVPGIADDTESKIGESRKLGRGIARYILSEYYGYTWFGKIQTLLTNSQDGWTVERPPSGGDTPDWLISNGSAEVCIGEAKGTHSHIVTDSNLVEKWRKQCTNIIVKKDNNAKKIKSWLIATRFVNEKKDKPEQLIEDPYTEGEELRDLDFPSVNKYIVRSHLSNALFRLGLFRLGIRILQYDLTVEKFKVMTWRPLIKEISHLCFIGRPIGNIGSNLHFREYAFMTRDRDHREEFFPYYEMWSSNTYFDGIALNTIETFLNDSIPKDEFSEYNLDKYPFVSLLKDGNLIIPMSLMQPDKVIEL